MNRFAYETNYDFDKHLTAAKEKTLDLIEEYFEGENFKYLDLIDIENLTNSFMRDMYDSDVAFYDYVKDMVRDELTMKVNEASL